MQLSHTRVQYPFIRTTVKGSSNGQVSDALEISRCPSWRSFFKHQRYHGPAAPSPEYTPQTASKKYSPGVVDNSRHLQSRRAEKPQWAIDDAKAATVAVHVFWLREITSSTLSVVRCFKTLSQLEGLVGKQESGKISLPRLPRRVRIVPSHFV